MMLMRSIITFIARRVLRICLEAIDRSSQYGDAGLSECRRKNSQRSRVARISMSQASDHIQLARSTGGINLANICPTVGQAVLRSPGFGAVIALLPRWAPIAALEADDWPGASL